jgi:hypothetical protein
MAITQYGIVPNLALSQHEKTICWESTFSIGDIVDGLGSVEDVIWEQLPEWPRVGYTLRSELAACQADPRAALARHHQYQPR